MSKEALEFLYKINPSFKNMDIDNTNTFGGKFLIYCIDKALKQGQSLPIDGVSKPLLNKVEPKGSWFFEKSSGYAGFRCQKCSTWIYEEQPKKCTCDNAC